jgi:hypothetical protein
MLPLKRQAQDMTECSSDVKSNKKRVQAPDSAPTRNFGISDVHRLIAECFNLDRPMEAVKV